MVLTLYYDIVSQPSRAVYMLLKVSGVDFKEVNIDPLNPTKPKDFLEINPAGAIPVIKDDKFTLTESVAILRYLAVKFDKKVPENLYPRKDVQKMARVDEFLSWQHTGLRKHCVQVFLEIFLDHKKMKTLNPELLKTGKENVEKSVKFIADYFLNGKDFIAGNVISAADILGVSELIQLNGVNEEGLYTSNKTVNAWVERVKDKLKPHFEKTAEKVMQIRKEFLAESGKKK